MKDLKAVKGRYLLARLIEEGEHEHQDFKFSISDARKIARSVSAFANNDGGHLLVGVKDNGVIAGVRNEEDIYVIEQAATMYCRPSVDIEVKAYTAGDGLHVLKVDIPRAECRPVEVHEADGRYKAYYRVKDENIAAHPLMVRAWRCMADDSLRSTMQFSPDSPERRVLTAIAETGDEAGYTPERLAVVTHLSKSAVEDTLLSLITMGLAEMVYRSGHWCLISC